MDLKAAGKVIDRSAATISRLENGGIPSPRRIDVLALLDAYEERNPGSVTDDLREALLDLVEQGKKKAWHEPFRSLVTGEMVSAHFMTLMEYETDASEIRSYEADLIPGLLQTGEYALAIAEIYFPLKGVAQHLQLVEFRMARQKALQDRRARLSDGAEIKLTFIVNEVALRRRVGDSAVYRRQLEKLIDDVASDQQEIRVVRSTVTLPATLGGPFVLFSFPADSPEADLVYIESRTGGDYLTAPADVERYNGYFASLLEVALGGDEVVALLRSIIAGIGDPG